MHNSTSKIVISQMDMREHRVWVPVRKSKYKRNRLLGNTVVFAAVSLCLGLGVYSLRHVESSTVLQLTSGFEYDDTLGRLQYVSNILPESAMVFLNTDAIAPENQIPIQGTVSHPWTQDEPWLEYECTGDISACQSGEVMTIIPNNADRFTVRILHENGFESIYSGLHEVYLSDHDQVLAGQRIGTAVGSAAFELRKDGLSILPVFSDSFE